MNPSEFIKGVLRTAPKIDLSKTIPANRSFMNALCLIMNGAATINKYKRNIYYGTPLDLSAEESKDEYKNKTILIADRMFHSILGILTEAGELAEVLARYIQEEGNLDIVNLKEEMGDFLWYQGLCIDDIKSSFEEIMEMNNKKLKKRFPEGFSEDDAVNRDVDAERKVLEENKMVDEISQEEMKTMIFSMSNQLAELEKENRRFKKVKKKRYKIVVAGACVKGDCDCRPYDGMIVDQPPKNKDEKDIFHEFCTCYTVRV